LYRALVDRRLASAVNGAFAPTEHPFLYSVSATARDGVSLAALEEAALAVLDEVAARGVTEAELVKARNQLRARLVFDRDSVTNMAHQLGYFATVADLDLYARLEPSVEGVTLDDVARVAGRYLRADNRTVGWFEANRAAEVGRLEGRAS
jgi:zinc protease